MIADNRLVAFCNLNLVLTTSNSNVEAMLDTTDYTVNAMITWALDQSGCSAPADYASSSSNPNDANYQACLKAFLGPFQCNGVQNPAFDSTSLGGSYVYKSPNNGYDWDMRFEIIHARLMGNAGIQYELYANN